jgi:hypothetical protein
MKRRALALCAGLLLLGLMPGSALAASGVLDQSNPSNESTAPCSGGAAENPVAQTFTADKSGTLTEVDLWMFWGGSGTATVTASIENTSSGKPALPALATATATVTSTPAWVQFFPTPLVTITTGTAYAIVFTTGSNVRICMADPYKGAQSWGYDSGWNHYGPEGWSFAYQTFLAAATAAPPTVAMAFGAASIPVEGTTSLTFTITNPNTVPTLDAGPALLLGSLTNISFTDPLPAGLAIATPNNIVGSCGTITAAAGASVVSMAGLTLAAGAACTFAVDVVGVAPGVQANTTSAITSTQSDPGLAATASITVTALSTPAPNPTPTPTATPSQSVLAVTAAPVRTSTPPPTSTGNSRGPGGESPLLPLLALAAVAALAATTFVVRSESRVRHR